MADNQNSKSRRTALSERLKAKYPDVDFTDDEVLFGKIHDDYDDYDEQINGYKEKEGKLTELFSKDPRNAQFITDMAKGNDPWLAVINRLGIDGITDLLNDPSKQEVYAEENKKYVERLAKEKELEDEYQKNFSESMLMLGQIQQERGLSDDVIDAAFDLVIKIANEAVIGKFSAETIDMALKAINHDADVENANAEGVVQGKNEKVEEKLRKPSAGDGTATFAGSNNQAPAQRTRPMSVFEQARMAKS